MKIYSLREGCRLSLGSDPYFHREIDARYLCEGTPWTTAQSPLIRNKCCSFSVNFSVSVCRGYICRYIPALYHDACSEEAIYAILTGEDASVPQQG